VKLNSQEAVYLAFKGVAERHGPIVTEPRPEAGSALTCITGDRSVLSKLGFSISGHQVNVYVTDCHNVVGKINIQAAGKEFTVVIDNKAAHTPSFFANIRVQGNGARLFVAGLGPGRTTLSNILLRSSGQVLYWGRDATAVNGLIEIEGVDREVIIGDDCMLSSQVNVRNYDMHTVFDVESGRIINRAPIDVILEQHVWMGHGSFLLGAQRVGFGAIIGVGSLVKENVEPLTAVAGTPAHKIRSGVSWCRSAVGISEGTRKRLARLQQLRNVR
jgi:hypothetical protein